MARSMVTLSLAAGVLALGACASVETLPPLALSELDARCDDRGGVLTANGNQTGQPRADYFCKRNRRPDSAYAASRGNARVDLNRAVDRAIRRGY